MHLNYFVQSLLPDYPLHMEQTLHQECMNPPAENFCSIDATKTVLVLLESEGEQGISEQSLRLLEKIFQSMGLNQEQILYFSSWNKNLNLESLGQNLLPSKIKIIFFIGTTTMQHFLGKDKKISQNQGQIFDHSCQDRSFSCIPLYHPDFIALNISIKQLTWATVKNLIPWIKQQLS